ARAEASTNDAGELQDAAALCDVRPGGRVYGRGHARAGTLSGECAAHAGGRGTAPLQRTRRRMAGGDHGALEEVRAAVRSRDGARPDALSRSSLLLCAAQAGPARLSRAEGGGDGRG